MCLDTCTRCFCEKMTKRVEQEHDQKDEEELEEREQRQTEHEAWLHLDKLRMQNGISHYNRRWAPAWAKAEAECVAQKESEERRERRKLDLD